VEQLVGDGIELVLLHHHARLGSIELQCDQRVRSGFRVQDPHHLFGIDRDLYGLSGFPLSAAVHDRGYAARRAETPRLVFSLTVSFFYFKYCVHTDPRRSPFYVLASQFVFTFGTVLNVSRT
jgi:hypothetical protein